MITVIKSGCFYPALSQCQVLLLLPPPPLSLPSPPPLPFFFFVIRLIYYVFVCLFSLFVFAPLHFLSKVSCLVFSQGILLCFSSVQTGFEDRSCPRFHSYMSACVSSTWNTLYFKIISQSHWS